MNVEIKVIQADISWLEVDAVVNAANSRLAGGGGVDGAIHRAAGPKLHEECMLVIEKQGRCPAGEACITGSGDMPSKYVIHAVGPVWKGGGNNEEKKLADAYRNSLILASDNDVRTIAFPNISTGIYGFPKEKAADIAIETVRNYLENDKIIKKVIFCCFDDENYRIYNDKI